MARLNNRSLARIGLSFGAAALVALGTALPSFANTTDTNVTITGGGGLAAGAINFTDFSNAGVLGVTLNGSAQTPTASFSFVDIIDNRGTGVGWHLTLDLSQFTTGGGSPLVLPISSLTTRNTPTVSQSDPSSSLASTVTWSPAVLTALDGQALPTHLISAASGGGMGSFNISPLNLSLDVPANTKASATAYKSTATITLVTGP